MIQLLENLRSYKDQIIEEGLDYEKISLHHQRIFQSLKNNLQTELKINNTCTLHSGDVFSLKNLDRIVQLLNDSLDQDTGYYAAFVPAAGAASRYWMESSLEEKMDQFQQLRQKFESFDVAFTYENIERVPKAFYMSGYKESKKSFLEVKIEEHQHQSAIKEEIYICPLDQKPIFMKFAEAISGSKNSGNRFHFFEQDLSMSTLRFDPVAKPIFLEGKLSKVPAGHGMLVQLFPKLKKSLHSRVHSVFIRNIDNINGTSPSVVDFTKNFLDTHDKFLKIIRRIRAFFAQGSYAKANDYAKVLINSELIPQKDSIQIPVNAEYAFLWRVLIDCFALDTKQLKMVDKKSEEKLLNTFYQRPVNLFGLVPNRGKDIGGSPVWVDVGSHKLRMCIEQPHCSKEDQEFFLKDPKKNTHFNPVFVASEIPLREDAYADPESLFWILAKKNFQGKDVYYHETVLYELLGNSDLANCIFVDIIPELFNPHKKHSDIK